MINIFKQWIHRYFSDQEAIALLIILAVLFGIILSMGRILTPAIAALVFAYLMQGLVNQLTRRQVPQLAAVIVVFAAFMAVMLLTILVVIPLVWEQILHLVNALPSMVRQGQQLLMTLPEKYPTFINESQVALLKAAINHHLGNVGQWALSTSLAKLPNLVALMIYLVLVPILVFFFLKDKTLLLNWVRSLLPERRRLINIVALEMNQQIANYIRGKAIEIVIVGWFSYLLFATLGLNYSALLAVMVGLSVVVPYIGAVVVTVPVVLIGFFQFGIEEPFIILVAVYTLIQVIDGNVLVPLLFSETVNLHPVAIIVAVLVFGGIWGFWGVFFAIPLATLLKAVMSAWPEVTELEENEQH